ncbi:DUF5677 domain-containing protein [Deinococcus sp. QL22]|uniref:DUF5677 domain-containing protein n=1 Tax=Deinococcus sp. QL22 TaxID=2939437 RepID=UPI0020178E23|nr:DUF5677 domain-containing protein [Deinococcus sp. QL22]UQN08432.1 DUF5677 domain-containing protein [Deinococcus sp. QL22]
MAEPDPKKIGDFVSHSQISEVAEAFRKIAQTAIETKLIVSQSRRDEDVKHIMINMLSYVSRQCTYIAQDVEQPIEKIAWAVRNLFELNLEFRSIQVLQSWKKYIAARARDEVDMLEGILSFADDQETDPAKTLIARIEELKAIAQRNGFDISKRDQTNYRQLAVISGVEQEYLGFYRFYSKFIHPTSWLINASDESKDSFESRNIFYIQGQKYSWDLIFRIKDELDKDE